MQEHWFKSFYLVNKVSKEMHQNIKKYWWEMHLEPTNTTAIHSIHNSAKLLVKI